MRRILFQGLVLVALGAPALAAMSATAQEPGAPAAAARLERNDVDAERVLGFSNTSTIFINEDGLPPTTAAPYPSTIQVSGAGNVVTDVLVVLVDIGHPHPNDVDVLLVGPQGQTAMVMSDAGGNVSVNNVDLLLEDGDPPLPTSELRSGSFQPTNISGVDNDAFPSPAPTHDGTSSFAVFNGTNPNGAWRLFVMDDFSPDGGCICGGWTLVLTTNAKPVANDDAFQVKTVNTLRRPAPGVLANDTDADGDSLKALLVKNVRHGTISFKTDGSFTYQPDQGFVGNDSFLYEVSDGRGLVDRGRVTIKVKA